MAKSENSNSSFNKSSRYTTSSIVKPEQKCTPLNLTRNIVPNEMHATQKLIQCSQQTPTNPRSIKNFLINGSVKDNYILILKALPWLYRTRLSPDVTIEIIFSNNLLQAKTYIENSCSFPKPSITLSARM